MAIKNELVRIRLSHGLSQQDLAILFEESTSIIDAWESGARHVPFTASMSYEVLDSWQSNCKILCKMILVAATKKHKDLETAQRAITFLPLLFKKFLSEGEGDTHNLVAVSANTLELLIARSNNRFSLEDLGLQMAGITLPIIVK